MKFTTKNKILIIASTLGVILYLLPVTGLAFNSNKLLLGIPITVLTIFIASAYLVFITLTAFFYLFLPWAKKFDQEEK